MRRGRPRAFPSRDCCSEAAFRPGGFFQESEAYNLSAGAKSGKDSLVESFSGVRGIFGSSLTEDTASKYALAYLYTLARRTARFSRRPLLVIGHDTRASSVKVYRAMASSLRRFSGIVYLGFASTPAVEFMVRRLKAEGGIIITASHNPPEFSGWKFLSPDGAVLPRSLMAEVIRNYRKKSFEEMDSFLSYSLSSLKPVPSVRRASSVRPYVSFLLSLLPKNDISLIRKKRFKIVFDPNGGAAIPYLPLFSSRLALDSRVIGSTIGEFHRAIEPTSSTLSGLSSLLAPGSFGVGFDCDADRAELVLPSGGGMKARVLSGNHLLALVVMSVLEFHPEPSKQVVVVNDAASDLVRDVVNAYGAKLVEVEVGEANVVSEMLKRKSIVGGEGSSAGAIVHPSRCRDGLLGTLFVLRLLARKNITIEQALSLLPAYHTLRANIRIPSGQGLNARLKEMLVNDGASVTSKGGSSGSVKARFENGFVWFRASKTEPSLFRVIADSRKKSHALKLLAYGKKLLKEAAG
ncbi:hypothetical protein D6764_03290 [Candidatus Woesearchaeota archaeon]|nr:MAG: hypothetical protein D6764_03290 [Candidatus Woesearchaeota archaeon]